MRKLKTTIFLALIFCLVNMVSYGQERRSYLEGNIFHTTLESGVGEKIKMEFRVDSTEIRKIMNTDMFKDFQKRRLNSSGENSSGRPVVMSEIESFLSTQTFFASFYARMKLKNMNSYTPINGRASISSDNNEITIVFPMKGQNGYGNYIVSRAFYVVKWVNGEEKVSNFISDNR